MKRRTPIFPDEQGGPHTLIESILTLLILALLFGGYIVFVFQRYQDISSTMEEIFKFWGTAIFLSLLLVIIGAYVALIFGKFIAYFIKSTRRKKKEAILVDKLDVMVEFRSSLYAGYILLIGYMLAMGILATKQEPTAMFIIVFLSPFVASIFSYCHKIYLYFKPSKGTKYLIHNNIRNLRSQNDNMTQKHLARQVGMHRRTIRRLEEGKYVPSLELAYRIAEVFQVTLSEVFDYIPQDAAS